METIKELSIEEKAKAYDEAFEKARMWKNKSGMPKDKQGILDDIFPELKESGEEDERIRKAILNYFTKCWGNCKDDVCGIHVEDAIDWLEKQAEHANFRNNIQVGDRVTRNEAGVLVNISQLNRIAKPRVTNKIEPKFHEGDWVILTAGELSATLQIVNVDTNKKLYWFNDSSYLPIVDEECLHLWNIKDAKPGDVLATSAGAFIYNGNNGGGSCPGCYCGINTCGIFKLGVEHHWTGKKVYPATKEQRDLLFQKMKEAGYTFDFEKKELEKIEDEVNGEDYGIDGLYHAQRILEKTLGEVDGYQSDDGILEHKCAITTVKKLYAQKSAESRQETKPNGGIIYEDFNEGDGSYKVNLAYLSKPQVELIENLVVSWQNHANNSVEWSEEDKDFMYDTLSNLTELKDRYGEGYGNVGKCIKWLKSLKQRYTWKPSDEQMDALLFVVQHYTPKVTDKLAWDSIKTLELMYHEIKQ